MIRALLAALLLLGGCSTMGEKTLVPGLDEPRDLAKVEITEHGLPPVILSMKCAQLYGKYGFPALAAIAALPTDWIMRGGCAFAPWGDQVPETGPWCEYAYLLGCEACRQYERYRCQGYMDHIGGSGEVTPTVTAER